MISTLNAGPGAGAPTSHAQVSDPGIKSLATEFGQILNQLMTLVRQAGSSHSGAAPATATAPATAGTSADPAQAGNPATAPARVADGSSAAPSTSSGTGPNEMKITNNEDHAITVGKFQNGGSTTDPSAKITLQPHQSGTLKYQNGEAGYAAQADAGGKFQSTASRLEYEADKDGKMKYPDVSYIDGRNASIALTDGAGLDKGDNKSIAGAAPPGVTTTDSGGNKTVAGWYDGSTPQMQAGGAFMQNQLGTSGAYLHPNDDTLAQGQNPMSGTQSTTIEASFGNA